MKRYVTYMIQVLRAHGVEVENAKPKCIGPIDPRDPSDIKGALQLAAREAYMSGKCSPQLICAVLPGR
jgi:eukaryotic translation initiation factor 2C